MGREGILFVLLLREDLMYLFGVVVVPMGLRRLLLL